MKKFKNKNFAYGAATLLVGAMSFSSCSSNEEAIDPNPSYDGKSVKTQFAINIPHATQGTRMAADETQETGFKGMYDIKLLPMQASGSDGVSFTSVLSLASITSKPTDPSWTGDKSFGKIYNDVNVPVGTSHFLFYAAGGASQPTSADDKFASGIINSTISGSNTDGIKFELEKAKVGDTADEGTKLLTVLNGVIGAQGWKEYADNTANSLKELKLWFDRVKSLTAGSANSICRLLQSLYNTVDQLAKSSEETEKTESDIAKAIQEAVTEGGVFTVSGSTPQYVLTTGMKYPRNMNMPDGSAVLSYNAVTNTFSYDSDNNVLPVENTKMDDICFPASIYYTVNTDLKATTKSDVTWPTSLDGWENGFPNTEWGSKVEVSTRTIALTKPIQYSVAKLVTTVQCGSASLADSKGTKISVPADGFPVKGILIGGQPVSSKWDFKPAGETTDWKNVIYDRAVPTTMAAKANIKSDANYTLVMDNYDNNNEQQQQVHIILELENTSSSDFYGIKEQIIPTGGHFYLLASLNPLGKTVGSVTKPSVFMQDYKTTANVTINSLKDAYNVIPDLRATNLKFGLAVDLDWTNGLEFDVIIGGDNNGN